MNGRLTCLLALLAALTTGASAGEEPREDPLAWLVGHWCAESDGDVSQEYWMPDHGGMRLGLARTLRQERTTAFEFLRIVTENGVPVYIAQPNGSSPVRFVRSSSGPGWIAFENRAHDFPQRIEYRSAGENRLRATIAGPGEGGKELVIAFDYASCRIGS
jgi:hypothetical protein